MKITVIGRGNVGGGLARRWQAKGHTVTALGKDGGDASGADVVVVAVPSGEIADALSKVKGLRGKVTVDATNALNGRNDAHASLAHEVKSIVRGPVAKSFNLNFANLYDEIDKQRARPGQFYAAEDDAKAATETLIRDAGYEPLFVGGLDMARKLEDEILGGPFGAVMKSNAGPFFYRYAKPGEL